MITQAIVLAAGLGTRLQPLTNTCPKPMLNVNKEPLLIHVLRSLEHAGITDVVVHVSYLHNKIIENIGDGKCFGLTLKITYSYSKEPLESGGGIEFSLSYLPNTDKPFICVNSDIFTDYKYDLLTNLLINHQSDIGHMVLVPNPAQNISGDYNIDNNSRLTKNFESSANHDYTFSGIAVYHPYLITNNSSKSNKSKYSIVETINASIDKFSASIYRGVWHDIGSIDRYKAINNKFSGENTG